MDIPTLRATAIERAGNRCEWPNCQHQGAGLPLQMAHLHHRGMGGSEAANTLDNTAMLCQYHHDLLDGRAVLAGRRYAVATLLNAYLTLSRIKMTAPDEDEALCSECAHPFHGSSVCQEGVQAVGLDDGDSCGCGGTFWPRYRRHREAQA